MSYVLKLAGWYPNKDNPFHGDFVQRHARSIAQFEKTILVFAVKSATVKKITVSSTVEHNLTAYICYYPIKKIGDTLFSNYYYWKLFKELSKLIFSENGLPKIVHVNIAWKAGLWALYLKRKYGCNYVITENWTGYYATDPNYVGKKPLQYRLLKKVFKNATHFLPVTKDLAITCNRLFGLQLPYTVIENAVDIALFHPIVHPNPKMRLLHVSTMNHQKNIEGLLEVIEKISQTRDDFELILIGPCKESIQERINRSNHLKKVAIITGNITYNKVAEIVNTGDLMVLFSRYENLPCVILEALCAGLPVIATDVGGIREVISNTNGILIKSEDQHTLEQALLTYLDHKKSVHKNYIAGDAISRFSYAAIGKKYQEAYQLLLK
jgi:glycosyltransferase involved in cell wall biosynthesis